MKGSDVCTMKDISWKNSCIKKCMFFGIEFEPIVFSFKTESFSRCPQNPLHNQDFIKKRGAYLQPRTTDTRRLNLKFFAAQIQIPLPNKYLGVGYKGLVFCRNNGWIMENMDKELTVPKWVLIVRPKIPQMPQKISAQNVCPSPKVRDFWKKSSLWMSVVHVLIHE